MSYTGWLRWRATAGSDPDAAAALLPQGRKLLGQMMDGLRLVDQRTGVLRVRLAGGSTITASFDGTTPMLEFDVPATEEGTPEDATSNLWVPRGFVVYPAWHDAPFGVGLPIVPSGDDPWAARNLAPGLDPGRWTPGGPCGEVLLSQDAQAGYPDAKAIPVPMLYHPSKGPVLHWAGEGNYDARPATGAWQGYRLELSPYRASYDDENPAQARDVVARVNALRVAAQVPAGTSRLRGYGRPGEVMASVMRTAGTTAESSALYPPTYRTAADRLTKEGYPADWTLQAFAGYARGDTFATWELRAQGAAADAVAAWAAAQHDVLAVDSPAMFLDVGWRGGYAALALTTRDRWIAAGNMGWQSSDPALPPLSWHGFAGLNLAWETFPAALGEPSGGVYPIVPAADFTTATGDCWLWYPRSKAPTSASAEPAMGRHVYCRGRAIALAPRGALVWGACVLRGATPTSGPNAGAVVDRLLLLAHHPDDQGDPAVDGHTRYLRVWWADVPRRRALALAPQQVICGTDPADALAWRGGTVVDVGHMPPPSTGGSIPPGACSSIKVASQWRFAPDGRRAVCLRDYGLMGDYQIYQTTDGAEARAVELVFDNRGDDVAVHTVWHDYTATPSPPSRIVDGTTYLRPRPLAVDYAGDGSLLYAFALYTDAWTTAAGEYMTWHLGTGPARNDWPANIGRRVLMGQQHATPLGDFAVGRVLVADVRHAAFVVEGLRARWRMADKDAALVPNPAWAECLPFNAAPVHGVRMFLGGRQVDERWHAMPDGAVPLSLLNNYCTTPDGPGQSYFAYMLPLAASDYLQAYWAQRGSDYVFSYQLSPTPHAAQWVLDSPPPGVPGHDACGCRVSAFDLLNNAHAMAYDELNPRGGAAKSSVPLPDNDWLVYAKVA